LKKKKRLEEIKAVESATRPTYSANMKQVFQHSKKSPNKAIKKFSWKIGKDRISTAKTKTRLYIIQSRKQNCFFFRASFIFFCCFHKKRAHQQQGEKKHIPQRQLISTPSNG